MAPSVSICEKVAQVVERITCVDPALADITATEILRAIADEIEARREFASEFACRDVAELLRTEAVRGQ